MNNMTVEQDPDTKEYYAVDYEGKDYEFGANPDADKAVNFEINPSLRK